MPGTLNTVENTLARAGFDSTNWVPEHEKYPHIVTKNRYGIIALLGAEDLNPEAKFDRTTFKTVPALIKSTPSNSMNPKIDQYTELPTEFVVSAAVTTWTAGTGQNVTFTSTGGLSPYKLVRDRSNGSTKIVISVTSATVAVLQSFSGGASLLGTEDIAADANMEMAGSAWIDGATVGDGVRSTPDQNDNYMQTHLDSYAIAMVEEQLKKYPGEANQMDTRRRLARINHNQAREIAMLFGSKVANTTVDSNGTIYGMAGLTSLSTREINAGGSLTLDEWNTTVMPQVAQYGGGDFHAMVGGEVFGFWSTLAADHIRTTQADRLYGNKVERIQTSGESITLHGTRPMNNRPGEMLMFQPDMLVRKYLPKFNSVHMVDMGQRNILKAMNFYLTVESLIARNEDVISMVKGVN